MTDISSDVIIVGGGPAGLTASIYTSRERLDTLLLEQAVCGGLAGTTDLVENYPGFPDGINGKELIAKFKEQALAFGANIVEFTEVEEIEPAGNRVIVRTSEQEYRSHAVIVASGSVPKKLNIPGEEEYTGRGVSYCATCDGPLFRDKDIAVVGTGNSGLQEGEFLLKHVKSITFVECLPRMTGARILQERLRKSERTKLLLNHMLTSVEGDALVRSVTVKNSQTGEEEEVEVSGVFIYAGWLPNSKFLEGVVELDELGYVVTNGEMETSVPGIYAAGDVRRKKVRQIGVACGEGTVAALSARDYVAGITGALENS
jgi:thioredoxin reductase (NADPH)